MKLLFDQNLSARLVDALGDLFPDSMHVRDVDLHKASDDVVWDFAKENAFAITTRDVESLLRARNKAIVDFGGDPDSAFLVLDRT